MKKVLFVILVGFVSYKLYNYFKNRTPQNIKLIKQIDCEALPPAKHNNNIDKEDPWY